MAPEASPVGHGDSFRSGAHSAALKCVEGLSSLPQDAGSCPAP